MSAQAAQAQALELWRNGFERYRRGDLRAAVKLYRRSIETCPTAEAHTFLGCYNSRKRPFRVDDAR